jgi:ABC-type multidrug transport system fused ATPase/permease subunit
MPGSDVQTPRSRVAQCRTRMLNSLLKTVALLNRDERVQVVLTIAFLVGNVLLETVGVAMIFPLVKVLIDPESIFQFSALAHAYRSLGFHEPRQFLVVCALAFLCVIILKNAYNAWLTSYQERLCHQISSRVGTRLIHRYLHDPWSVLSQRNSADMIHVADVMSGWPLTNALRGYPVLATEGILCVTLASILFWIAPQPALVCVVIFGAALFVSHTLVRRRLISLSAENARLGAARIRLLQESLGSIKEIKILGCEAQFIAEYAEARQRDASNLTRLLTWQSVPRALVEPMAVAGMTAAILAISVNSEHDPAATAALLGLFAVAGVRLTPSLTRMLVAANSIRASSAPVDRISADLADPVSRESGKPGPAAPQLRTAIQADNITFHYARGRTVLHQLSFSINKGETVGLTGPSGSGKSTLADLLTGLLSPDTGSIRVDGADIARDIKGWQRQIGYIPQAVSLIDATLRENIALGVKDHQIDAARMRDAIAFAQLGDVLRKMPLDAKLGERGVCLSGGERQRIGIARALYHGRSVLILDEATSALDGETENEIGLALARLHGKYTVLIIAHRLSTMRRCDRIMTLQDGHITARESPQEMESRLMNRGSLTQGRR